MRYDEYGREIPDPRPLAMPAGLRAPESLQETMRRLIRVEMSRQAVEAGLESFEEADDFDVEDGEALMATPYEMLRVQEEAGYREAESLDLPFAQPTPGVGVEVKKPQTGSPGEPPAPAAAIPPAADKPG